MGYREIGQHKKGKSRLKSRDNLCELHEQMTSGPCLTR